MVFRKTLPFELPDTSFFDLFSESTFRCQHVPKAAAIWLHSHMHVNMLNVMLGIDTEVFKDAGFRRTPRDPDNDFMVSAGDIASVRVTLRSPKLRCSIPPSTCFLLFERLKRTNHLPGT